jgi:hypothetical protein
MVMPRTTFENPLLPMALRTRMALGRRWFQRHRQRRPNLRTVRVGARSKLPTSSEFSVRSTAWGRAALAGFCGARGLYSSALTDWRRQRDAGAYEALKAVKRGPRCAPIDPVAVEHAQLVLKHDERCGVSDKGETPMAPQEAGITDACSTVDHRVRPNAICRGSRPKMSLPTLPFAARKKGGSAYT